MPSSWRASGIGIGGAIATLIVHQNTGVWSVWAFLGGMAGAALVVLVVMGVKASWKQLRSQH